MAPSRRVQTRVAFAGLALALAGALTPRNPFTTGRDAVAFVNDVPIPRAALARAEGRSDPGAGETRAALLARLVDEELLVQRAVEIGLVDSDRSIRKALARAAIDLAVREAEARAPTEAELRAFHAANPGLFLVPRRARVRAISFYVRGAADATAIDAALRRAQEAADAIAGGLAFDAAAARFGDRPPLPLADALLPEPVLRRVLGPALADAALALAPGGVSAPVRAAGGVHLLQLAAEDPAQAQPFDAARPQVERALRRQRGETALAELLARLRPRARIARAADAPAP